MLAPAYARVPMGWSLAVHVTVAIINSELTNNFKFINLNRPSCETYDLAVGEDEGVAGAFIDNVYALGAARAEDAARVLGETLQLNDRGETVGITIKLENSDRRHVLLDTCASL